MDLDLDFGVDLDLDFGGGLGFDFLARIARIASLKLATFCSAYSERSRLEEVLYIRSLWDIGSLEEAFLSSFLGGCLIVLGIVTLFTGRIAAGLELLRTGGWCFFRVSFVEWRRTIFLIVNFFKFLCLASFVFSCRNFLSLTSR